MKVVIQKFYRAPECRLDRWVQILSLIGAIAAFLYYIGIGIFVGFGVSLLFVWLLLGLCLAVVALRFPSIRRGWKRLRKRTRTVLTVCLSIALLSGLLCVGSILSGFVCDIPEGEAVDCLIILGAQVKADRPSLALSYRIKEAYAYLSAHPETIAIASGGQGADEPMSEARCIFECLVEMGISPERIILEERSTSTAENLQFSAALLPEGCETVAIVTNNFHAFRGQCTARKYLPDAEVYRLPAEFHLYMLPHYLVREVAAFAVDTLRGNLKFGRFR